MKFFQLVAVLRNGLEDVWRSLWKRYLHKGRGELSYLAPLGSEKISAPYFKQCFFRGGGGITPQAESNTTPPSPRQK
jgi:hypothetical protein